MSAGLQPGVTPVRFQIALALAIVKSKPEGITVRSRVPSNLQNATRLILSRLCVATAWQLEASTTVQSTGDGPFFRNRTAFP
jgi:hypothetical protein